MAQKTAQEIIDQEIIIGLAEGIECAIFSGSLQKRCEKKGDKENSVFINTANLEGNKNPIPTQINKVNFCPEDDVINIKIRTLLINKALKDCQLINKDKEACNLVHYQ
ncbi:MAG: hypothetical protein WCJ57_03300 [Candidatus Falkowbacteria bacterium]